MAQELEPVEYQLAITVFYDNAAENKGFSSTFFNQTIQLHLSTSEYDIESIFWMLWGFATLFGIILLSYVLLVSDSKWGAALFAMVSKSSYKKTGNGVDKSDDWIEVNNSRKKKSKNQQ